MVLVLALVVAEIYISLGNLPGIDMKHTSEATFLQSNSVSIKNGMAKQLGLQMEQEDHVQVIIYLDLCVW